MDKRIEAMSAGERIKELREKIGISREDFWEITGFSSSTLRKFETSQRKLSVSKARLLSLIFIYRFGLSADEASEEFILYGTSKVKK